MQAMPQQYTQQFVAPQNGSGTFVSEPTAGWGIAPQVLNQRPSIVSQASVVQQPQVTYSAQQPQVQYAAQQPQFTYAAPQPAVTYAAQQPTITYGAPQPAVTYAAQQPTITYGAPQPAVMNAMQQPGITYGQPTVTYGQPKITYGAPQPAPVQYAPQAQPVQYVMAPREMSGTQRGIAAEPVSYTLDQSQRGIQYGGALNASMQQVKAGSLFDTIDRNRDGVISMAEFNQAFSSPQVRPVTRVSKAPVVQKSVGPKPWRVKLGAEMPNFFCNTTHGDFHFHEFLTSDPDMPFTVFFSHPKDYTPVCTTELGRCEQLTPFFQERGVKLIGVSCDPVEEHLAWSADILHREQIQKPDGQFLNFPIIADANREIVTLLGMIDPDERDAAGIPLPARALIVIGPDKKVKLSILYPATTGRNFEEVVRVIDSLQLTAGMGLATPVDWRQGERCIVAPVVSTEDALARFTNLEIEDMPSGKQYLRTVDCPVQEAAAGEASLWDRMGGEEIIRPLCNHLYELHSTDPLTAPWFALHGKGNIRSAEQVKENVFTFFSAGIGGPHQYEGRDMKEAHKHMVIDKHAFHALTNHVFVGMEKFGTGGPQERDDVYDILWSLRPDVMHGTEANPQPKAETEESLWNRMGGETKVRPLCNYLYELHSTDPLTAPWFTPMNGVNIRNSDEVKEHVFTFFSAGIGGPHAYEGRDMKEAHKNMKIDKHAFHALTNHVFVGMERFDTGGAQEREEVYDILWSLRPDVMYGTEGEVVQEEVKSEAPAPDADKDHAAHANNSACEWMFGDVAQGWLGIHAFAHLNPLRWTGGISFETAITNLEEVQKHEQRKVIVKVPPNTGNSQDFDTIAQAIEFFRKKQAEA